MTGRDFLQASEYLLKRKTEATFRSAVSRSYYALFHESRALLEELQIPCSKGPQAHGEVRRLLNNAGDAKMLEVYRLLAQLHKHRIIADYDLLDQSLHDASTCALLVKSAGIGIDYLDDARKSSERRRQIHQSIVAYERQIQQSSS